MATVSSRLPVSVSIPDWDIVVLVPVLVFTPSDWDGVLFCAMKYPTIASINTIEIRVMCFCVSCIVCFLGLAMMMSIGMDCIYNTLADKQKNSYRYLICKSGGSYRNPPPLSSLVLRK